MWAGHGLALGAWPWGLRIGARVGCTWGRYQYVVGVLNTLKEKCGLISKH